MRTIEIFAGAGGLALGVSAAGFEHIAVIESDPYACATIRANQRRGIPLVRNWPLHEIDVRHIEYTDFPSSVDLLSAGVPCQPFSVAGRGAAHHDDRDMFSEIVRAVRHLLPKAILIENVPGLLRARFRAYFDYLLSSLASPLSFHPEPPGWRAHLAAPRRSARRGARSPVRYDVHVHAVNAANYGVPQWRDRVLIVAFRSDLGINWSPPHPTHDLDALLWTQWKTGHYWRRHGLDRPTPTRMSRRIANRLRRLRESRPFPRPPLLPWRTVRDAISDLPPLHPARHPDPFGHALNPGARPYPRHTGSLLDEPAKTLKAGSHGVPGGENSLSIATGRLRYFSVRECARLQTFPDDYVFVGPWSRAMRQLGNAVPVRLARVVAQHICDHLQNARTGPRFTAAARAHSAYAPPPTHATLPAPITE